LQSKINNINLEYYDFICKLYLNENDCRKKFNYKIKGGIFKHVNKNNISYLPFPLNKYKGGYEDKEEDKILKLICDHEKEIKNGKGKGMDKLTCPYMGIYEYSELNEKNEEDDTKKKHSSGMVCDFFFIYLFYF
jgi:hypothetical protein